jgi:hypothetical protein
MLVVCFYYEFGVEIGGIGGSLLYVCHVMVFLHSTIRINHFGFDEMNHCLTPVSLNTSPRSHDSCYFC